MYNNNILYDNPSNTHNHKHISHITLNHVFIGAVSRTSSHCERTNPTAIDSYHRLIGSKCTPMSDTILSFPAAYAKLTDSPLLKILSLSLSLLLQPCSILHTARIEYRVYTRRCTLSLSRRASARPFAAAARSRSDEIRRRARSYVPIV